MRSLATRDEAWAFLARCDARVADLGDWLDRRAGVRPSYWLEYEGLRDALLMTVWADYVGKTFLFQKRVTAQKVLSQGRNSFLDDVFRFLEEGIEIIERDIRAYYAELCQVRRQFYG